MEDRIKGFVKDVNDAYCGKRLRFECLDEYDVVASKEGLRMYAAKLLEASLMKDESVMEFDMSENFEYDMRDVIVTIRVSETWKPEANDDSGNWMALLFIFGTTLVGIAGMVKIYEWVK